MDKNKREYRKLKRSVKRSGSKRRRRHLKQDLADHPENAQFSEYEFRGDSSATLNGLDSDSTRKKEMTGEQPRE
jgi:hypothetical protein